MDYKTEILRMLKKMSNDEIYKVYCLVLAIYNRR